MVLTSNDNSNINKNNQATMTNTAATVNTNMNESTTAMSSATINVVASSSNNMNNAFASSSSSSSSTSSNGTSGNTAMANKDHFHVALNGRLTTYGALELIKQIGTGLKEMHERGMVHMDVKPDNMLIPVSYTHLTLPTKA